MTTLGASPASTRSPRVSAISRFFPKQLPSRWSAFLSVAVFELKLKYESLKLAARGCSRLLILRPHALTTTDKRDLSQDFSTPCFDGEHHVIVGGSFASTGNEASVFARFHFRPHFHQHAGFRLVAIDKEEDAQEPLTSCTGA